VLVLVVANTPLYPGLNELLDPKLVVTFADRGVAKPLLLWINDAAGFGFANGGLHIAHRTTAILFDPVTMGIVPACSSASRSAFLPGLHC